MRFNPLFWLANLFRLGKLKDVVGKAVPIVTVILSWMWVPTSFVAIPIPVKVTYIFGDPIETEGKSVDDIAAETKASLQKLIDDNQPQGHAYLPGLKARFSSSSPVAAKKVD